MARISREGSFARIYTMSFLCRPGCIVPVTCPIRIPTLVSNLRKVYWRKTILSWGLHFSWLKISPSSLSLFLSVFFQRIIKDLPDFYSLLLGRTQRGVFLFAVWVGIWRLMIFGITKLEGVYTRRERGRPVYVQIIW